MINKLIFFLCAIPLLYATSDDVCNWPSEWRKQALVRLDLMVGKAIPFQSRTFAMQDATFPEEKTISSLVDFAENHGYFSCSRPLVGIVTTDPQDLQAVQKALVSCMQFSTPHFAEIAVAELLTKALAYRNLKAQDVIQIPTVIDSSLELIPYAVEQEFDLWQGMPAFGLIPKKPKAPPILLFRGTDFSLLSKKSWASILSDLDIDGIGLSVFTKARSSLHNWLASTYKKTGVKAKAMGFSLGGILSLYTAFFEGDLLAKTGSFAFNPPGLPSSFCQKWQAFGIALYVTEGDLVSKLGQLVPPSFVFSTKQHLGPIEAHTKLMTVEPCSLHQVLLLEENKHRFTMK